MRYIPKFVLSFTVLACTWAWSGALAQEISTPVIKATQKGRSIDLKNPQGLVYFLGIGSGYFNESKGDNTEGMPFNTKLIGSYYAKDVLLISDIGLGLQTQFIERVGDDKRINAAVLELATRYPLQNRVQVGPVLNTLFGGGDDFGSSSSKYTTFIGAQALKEFTPDNKYLMRVGLKALTDVGIPNKTVNAVMLDLEIALARGKKELVITRIEPVVEEPSAVVIFRERNVNYPMDAYQLRSADAKFVSKVADILREKSNLFERVEIIGHTDKVGAEDYNLELSKKRALTVSEVLKTAGLNDSRIQVSWRGESEPIENVQGDSYINRRVELKFFGAKDDLEFSEMIEEINSLQ